MGDAALGIRPHCGWAVVVALTAPPACELLVRRRIEVLAEVRGKGHDLRVAGIVGEPHDLPPAAQILRNHALLHSAEGELYRSALTCAAAEAGLPVTCFHPRSVPVAGYADLLARIGKGSGRPWNADHRLATVVALEALASEGDG